MSDQHHDPKLEPCMVCCKMTEQSFCSFDHAEEAAGRVRRNRKKFREGYQ